MIFDARSGSNESIASREMHVGSIKCMKYNHEYDTVISADDKGIIEYWNPASLQFPENGVTFRLKSDADLFAIIKCKTTICSIEMGINSQPHFLIVEYGHFGSEQEN